MPSVRHGRLMRALQDADWARSNGTIRIGALHRFLREHVGDATLIVLGCALHSVQRSSWLSRLLHRPTSAQVPLQWLLLLEATRISLDTVLLRTIPAQVSETLRECAVDGVTRQPVIAASREQGTAFRWETLSAPIEVPCRNPFCDVFNPDETGRLGRKPLREGHYLIDCKSCGFAYFWNPKNPSWHRIFRTGAVWDNRLSAMVLKPNCTVAEVARALAVDPLTIRRYAARLGLAPRGWASLPQPKSHSGRRQRALQSHREKFLAVRALNPSFSRTDLQSHCKATCAFLRRHDPDWLEQKMPPVKLGRRESPSRRGYAAGGAAVAETVERILANLQSAVAPPAGLDPIPSRTKELGAISLAGPHGAAAPYPRIVK